MNHIHGNYLAHSSNEAGKEDLLHLHLKDVARRAAEYAEAFHAADEAKLAGLLHDLGKYGDLFQRRLEGKEHGIDHWSAGAWAALTEYKNLGIASALAIQGHHTGLQRADPDSLRELDVNKLKINHPLGLRLSEQDMEEILKRMEDDGLKMPEISGSIYDYHKRKDMPAAAMLDVRMLFSAVVDADYLETEAHFQATREREKNYREPGLTLEPEEALEILLPYLSELERKSRAATHVIRMRKELLKACLDSAGQSPGLFTLTAPTGAGKTLSLLAFALQHALKYELRRIVVVIPYLTIIEQTVREYGKVFKERFTREHFERYIIEDHSLAGTRPAAKGKDAGNIKSGDEVKNQARLLAENWDAPIVITTSVQLLESLFANRPAACRKLHRLSRSVILFDEVQTLPVALIVPTLAALSRLADRRYGSTVVFSTATQPAFTHLDKAVREFCTSGWRPREIVRDSRNLFSGPRRVRAKWPPAGEKVSWEQLAREINRYEQVLCIVNKKKHALILFDELCRHEGSELYHLSTNMCPAHRSKVLDVVRKRLEEKKPCRLVSTQCVEAGVDLDFPVVFRAFGPLEALAQAAGRCNRNGCADAGLLHVFVPELLENERLLYPDRAYRQAADTTAILLEKSGDRELDILSPSVFDEYYRELYSFARPENLNMELLKAVKRGDFVEAVRSYRVIEKDAVNVLVPYDLETYERLKEEVLGKWLRRIWIGRARPHTVGLFRPEYNDPVWQFLEKVPVGRKEVSDEWFIYLKEEHYDMKKGLVPAESFGCLIA